MVIVWIVFGQTLRFDFVSLDDNRFVYENSHISHGLTWTAVKWAFTAGLSRYSGNADFWRPLSFLSHALDIQLFGLRPAGHHLMNVVLHTASTVALFLVLRAMTRALWRSAFVAAIFAIHPLHVESVAWITERKDVLSGLFFILTLGAYVRYARHLFSFGRYLIVFALFALALMSKAMAVTLPCVLLLIDYWPLGRLNSWIEFRRLCMEKIPLFVLAAASALATTLGPANAGNVARLPFYSRLGNAVMSYVDYIGQMIYPAKLAVLYPRPESSWSFSALALPVLLLAVVSAAAVMWRKTYPFLLIGWLWYLGMLVPVIGLFHAGVQAPADRYAYLPQIGLYILITWSAAELSAKWRFNRRALPVLASIIIASLVACSAIQASYWHDSILLWC